MMLTRNFRETLRQRAQGDAAFRRAMLQEGIEALLAGETATGKSVLRDYINATTGFAGLSESTSIPAKSLMRMLGPKGNPRADNLFHIIRQLQANEGLRLGVIQLGQRG
jgi:hypothetical protein